MTTKIPVELSSTPSIVDNGDATAITIDSSENVGIGTSSPIRPLHVHGATSGDIVFAMTNNSTGATTSDGFNIIIEGPTPDVLLRNRENSNMRFLTNNTERMRIDNNGLIGVRNSSPASNGGQSDTALIHHHSPVNSGWAVSHYTNNNTGSAGGDGLIVGAIGTDYYFWSYDSGQLLFGHSTTTYAKIASNGDFYTNDGTVHSLSDKRIKKNIQPITEGLDVIKQLNPITFEYCNTNVDSDIGSPLGLDDGKVHKGFIADEVQEIAPSYVDETTGLVMGEEVNDLKSLSMTAMIPMLVKAIQEQQAIIEDLQQQINEVKNGN